MSKVTVVVGKNILDCCSDCGCPIEICCKEKTVKQIFKDLEVLIEELEKQSFCRRGRRNEKRG